MVVFGLQTTTVFYAHEHPKEKMSNTFKNKRFKKNCYVGDTKIVIHNVKKVVF